MFHRISNELVVEAPENGCSVIAFEDLTDMNQTGGDGDAPFGVHVNSGTSNANGGYSPSPSEDRAGVHAESHRFSGGELNLDFWSGVSRV